jgi:dinuclear metal center YbgI/SA1388 family protein
MHTIERIINFLETIAPLQLQEDYDNAGLVCGDAKQQCRGALMALDLTDAVLEEAIQRQFNLVVVHHPPIFRAIKRIVPGDPVTDLLLKAIRNDIAIYAIHTNLDNVLHGVNGAIAKRLGLQDIQVLQPLAHTHRKLITFVPDAHAEILRNALFASGAGSIGRYSECSFSSGGSGTFKPMKGANPFVGTMGQRHTEKEEKVEMLFPLHLQHEVVAALKKNHPYETVAYDLVPLENTFEGLGAGAIGTLPEPVDPAELLVQLKTVFETGVIRHSPLPAFKIQRVALCGGAGKMLINNALQKKAEAYITADLGYHDFFVPAERMLLADIGHFESEQYTPDLLVELVKENFPTFAVLKSGVRTNPVNYFL